MKRFFLTLALILGLSLPVAAQTLTSEGYLSVPKKHVQLISFKHWKSWSPFSRNTTYLTIVFVDNGIVNADAYNWVNSLVIPNQKIYADKERIIVGNDEISFYYLEVGALVSKSKNPSGKDQIRCQLIFMDGIEDDELQKLRNTIDQDFSGYTKSGGNYLFYEVTNYVRK